MRRHRSLAPFAGLLLSLLLSCGGAFSPAVGGRDDGGDASSSSSGGDSSSGAGDAASSETGTPDGSAGGDATSLDGSPGPCSDISGTYGQLMTTGLGCGDLNPAAPECIMLAQQICAFQLVSPTSGILPAVDGVVILQSDGSISNATLQLGTVQRTGCVGQWAPGTQTLTLDCGGQGTPQSCGVSMVLEPGAPCP